MSAARRQTHRGQRMRLLRPIGTLLALIACVLLIPAATASADVMEKHQTAYKTKLAYYQEKMDGHIALYEQWRQSEGKTSEWMQELGASYPNTLEAAKAGALEERKAIRKGMKRNSKKTYADIAEFRAKGVKWFKKPMDKKDFKAGLKDMRLAFELIFDAYKDVALAFGYLGEGPYYQTAANAMFRAGTGAMMSNDRFADGLKQLRKLQ